MGFVSFRVITVTELSKPSKAVQTKRTDEHSRQKKLNDVVGSCHQMIGVSWFITRLSWI